MECLLSVLFGRLLNMFFFYFVNKVTQRMDNKMGDKTGQHMRFFLFIFCKLLFQ